MDKLKPTRWTFVGTMANGERIYYAQGGELAIEKDHTYLVAPSPAELAETRRQLSFLACDEPLPRLITPRLTGRLSDPVEPLVRPGVA